MERYNEIYKGLSKMWKEANTDKKHLLVTQMFKWLSKKDKEEEKEYAILDFMNRWVFGINMSLDYSGLSCQRGFAQYAR